MQLNVLLFGSKARGDFHSESDIDIFILFDKVDSDVRKAIAHFTTKIFLKDDILLSPKAIEESHFSTIKRLETGFFKNIVNDGIKI